MAEESVLTVLMLVCITFLGSFGGYERELCGTGWSGDDLGRVLNIKIWDKARVQELD